MKRTLPLHGLALTIAACAGAQDIQRTECVTGVRGWCPAEYGDLIVGRSTIEDVLRQLGQPTSVEAPEPENPGDSLPPATYIFGDSDARAVEVWVSRPDNVVRLIVEYPKNLSRADLDRRFGSAGREVRYDFDLCLGDGESAPVFESPHGSLVLIEYRSRGIAARINWQGEVDAIEYLSKPYGAAESACAGAEVDGS